MKKIFCKRNLILGGVLLGVLIMLVLCLVFGTTENNSVNRKLDVLFYCLVAIFTSIVMFNCITKILDKKIKILFEILFGLFIFWLVIKMFNKVAVFDDNSNIIWYLLYVPLLFVPNLWFLINNQIYLKNKKLKSIFTIISLSISTILLILVLTNDFHNWVFILPSDFIASFTSQYKYNIGYLIIYSFIFIEILTTIVLFYVFSGKKTTIKQKILPSIIIVLIIIYSIVYVLTKISLPFFYDMSVVYVTLGTLLAYFSFKSGLIKNSGNYLEFFETCASPLAITNNQGEVVYQNEKYMQVQNNKNYVLESQSITNGTLLTYEDVGKLKSLQKELTHEINSLKHSNKLLEHKKDILQKEKQIEQHTKLLSKIEKQIESKKLRLEKLLSTLPNEITAENKVETKEILNEIKLIVGYLKRKTSLILHSEQKDIIPRNEVVLLFKESFNDLKNFGINAGIGIREEELPSDIILKFYDIYNELISSLIASKFDVWITINKKDLWEFKLTFEDKNIDKKTLKLPKEYNIEYIYEMVDTTAIYCFKAGER